MTAGSLLNLTEPQVPACSSEAVGKQNEVMDRKTLCKCLAVHGTLELTSLEQIVGWKDQGLGAAGPGFKPHATTYYQCDVKLLNAPWLIRNVGESSFQGCVCMNTPKSPPLSHRGAKLMDLNLAHPGHCISCPSWQSG